MKKNLTSIVSMAMTAVMFLTACKHNEPVDLKLNLQPGSQYLYIIDTKTSMEMGQMMKTNTGLMMETNYDVAAGQGNGKRITVSYDRIAMSVQNPMMNLSYDSKDSTKGDSTLRAMGNMLHKPFFVDVSDKGEILKVEGLEAIISGSGGAFNDSTAKTMMQQSLDVFPDHPVRPGDTWKKTSTMTVSMMNLSMDNEYKLKSVSGGTAHIDVVSKIKYGGIASPEMKNMQITMSGDQKGTMDVEIATGLMTDSKLKQIITGEVAAPMVGKMPLKMDQEIHLTAKKR